MAFAIPTPSTTNATKVRQAITLFITASTLTKIFPGKIFLIKEPTK
jgi:hypothetical protein